MNKADLVAAMAEKAGVSKKDAEASLKAFTDVVAGENAVPICAPAAVRIIVSPEEVSVTLCVAK